MKPDPTIKWIKIRSYIDGWITLRMDCIEQIRPISKNFFSLKMLSGGTIILNKRQIDRLLKRILPEGIKP